MKRHKGKRKKRVSRPQPSSSILGVTPMVDEALLDEETGRRAKKRQPPEKAAEHSAPPEKGKAQKKLKEIWNWLFETEIHSRWESGERILVLLIPVLAALLVSEVLIPRLFALLFG